MDDGVVLCGYHTKLKTLKKKYFVVYEGTSGKDARLEYFDGEKKFKQGAPPKRIIKLKHCFGVSQRFDTRKENTISLASESGPFGIIFDRHHEMAAWLEKLCCLHRQEMLNNKHNYPKFKHIWYVDLQNAGIAAAFGSSGPYYVCLSENALRFLKIGNVRKEYAEDRLSHSDIYLTSIRSCGLNNDCTVYVEVGRHFDLGPGELYMDTQKPISTIHMHKQIVQSMLAVSTLSSLDNFDTLKDPMRKRACSANEATKPDCVREKLEFQKKISRKHISQYCLQNQGRERCDSLPTAPFISDSQKRKSSNTTSKIASRNVIIEEVDHATSETSQILHANNGMASLKSGYDGPGCRVLSHSSLRFKPILWPTLHNTTESDNRWSYEKPPRTYSVGSAFEHKKLLPSVGESSSPRLRTLSVDSKLKVSPQPLQAETLASQSKFPFRSKTCNSTHYSSGPYQSTMGSELVKDNDDIVKPENGPCLYNQHVEGYLEMKPSSRSECGVKRPQKGRTDFPYVIEALNRNFIAFNTKSDHKPELDVSKSITVVDDSDTDNKNTTNNNPENPKKIPDLLQISKSEEKEEVEEGEKGEAHSPKENNVQMCKEASEQSEDKKLTEIDPQAEPSGTRSEPTTLIATASQLHYAKLDLPQIKLLESKTKEAACSVSINNQVLPGGKSSYAEIDFDKPDDGTSANFCTS